MYTKQKSMIDHKSDTNIPFSDDLLHNDVQREEFYSDHNDDIAYSDNHFYDAPLWDWAGPFSPVPGFGFYPQNVKEELEQMTQV